jgi:hypothetical protein
MDMILCDPTYGKTIAKWDSIKEYYDICLERLK